MTDHNDRLDVRSHDIVSDEIAKLLEIFPDFRSEGGRVDFDKLKAHLGANVAEGVERFGMSWPGKAESIRAAQKQSVATLLPVEKESVEFDTTQNVIIEGDNLEVLKLLQKSYLGKVKMIYIDPPYNTGKDFIYPDNYSESLQTYLEYTGQVDEEGKRFSTNTETDGRFHSKWMSMMYPRLMLARNLLTEDGVIFISIDDNELRNLLHLGNEVFGETNFVAVFPWRRSTGANDSKEFNRSTNHEYVVTFARTQLFGFAGLEKSESNYSNPDNDPRGPWTRGDLTCNKTRDQRPNLYYPITDPNTGIEYPANPNNVWRFGRETMESHIANGKILFPKSSSGSPSFKRHLADLRSMVKPLTTFVGAASLDELDSDDEEEAAAGITFPLNTAGSRELKRLLGGSFFAYPKPTELVRSLIDQAASADDLILDFFAGSGTTGHAVLAQNAKDGGSRRFILVQLPEPVEEGSEAAKAGFGTIADITKERVRRAAKEIAKEAGGVSKLKLADGSGCQDLGFRVFKLDKSNFRVWDAAAPAGDEAKLAEQLRLQVEHVEPGRKGQDVVFEVLLKSKLPLTSTVEKTKVSGGEVWSVESGRLLVVVDEGVDLAGVRELAKRDPKPETVVFLDRCFGGKDSLKANARKIFQDANIEFKTI